MKSLIVNLIAGPGAGKSTNAAKIFSILKENNMSCELVREFAKELTWKKDFVTLSDQVYVSATQNHRQYEVDGQVEVIVTDSPIILGILYYNEPNKNVKKYFSKFLIEKFKEQNNLVVYIKRTKPYVSAGRNQSESEAIEIDIKTRKLLEDNWIPYIEIDGDKKAANKIVKLIQERIKEKA